MKKLTLFFLLAASCAALLFSDEERKFQFAETWGYVMSGYENEFSPDIPVTDLCYFSAEIDQYGEIPFVPDRKKLPESYRGRVHLAAICESRSLSHFVLEPKYGVTKKIVRSLAEAAKDYDGLQIDFELVPPRDEKNFKSFLKMLRKSIGKDKMLSICVPARMNPKQDDVYDYASLEPYVDRIFIMAYDQHWSTSKPGPVAGMDWCQKIADHALKELPLEKIIMGMPFYGRTWASPSYSKAWYNSGINRILRENKSPRVQRTDGIPHFSFKAEVTVTGYFDDKDSLAQRCQMLKEKNIINIGFWRIGQEDKEFWTLLQAEQ